MEKPSHISNSSGMSIVEALGGLALMSLIIAITARSARHISSLQYVMDSRIIDQHFNRVHRILSYGNCDSLIGDKLDSQYVNTADTGIKRTDNSAPEIKIRRPLIDPVTHRGKIDAQGKPIYEYHILYAVKDQVSQKTYGASKYEPVDTVLKDSHISIKSMSLEKDPVFDSHARLKIIFYSRRSKKTPAKSKRVSERMEDLKDSHKGEFERTLKIYTVLKNGVIAGCHLTPPACLAETKKVFMTVRKPDKNKTVVISCTDKSLNPLNPPSISISLEKGLSGETLQYERVTDFCACNFNFYCRDGVWQESLICLERGSTTP